MHLAKQIGISLRQMNRILNGYLITEEVKLKIEHGVIGVNGLCMKTESHCSEVTFAL